MSEASDEFFDKAMEEEDKRWHLSKACERDGKQCRWRPNDDGLYECAVCGAVVDL